MRDEFVRLYGREPRVFRAPGRVNLIGEHTDYNEGFVMPAALDFSTWVAAAPRDDGRLVIRSLNLDEEVAFDSPEHGSEHHWSDYVRGVAWALGSWKGANLLVRGEVPLGSGLSSSAALEVASCLAFLWLSGRSLSGPDIARVCQRAENEYVGTRCGIMDQFISACAQAGHALLLDCRSLEARAVPLPGPVRLVICNTMVRHALAGGEYNARREACEEGARRLGLASLREARLDQVETLPEPLRRRCRHVVSENDRVLRSAEALERGDLAEFGQLMYASHASLRDDYEVSCAELDQLVSLAAATPGVYGGRMTGGGFGGCTVNLVAEDRLDDVVARFRVGYPGGEFYVASPAAGAGPA